jgi:hypothetical protein
MTPAVTPAAPPPAESDRVQADQQRLAAFCSPAAPEVFHSIVQPTEIWSADPFDVESIHQLARDTLARLLQRAAMSGDWPTGRLLVLKGESGSGKTHLMRAFRNFTHANERGYFGYLQMTSRVSNYARYVLAKLIDALDQPYRWPEVEATGLTRLAVGVLEAVPGVPAAARARFRAGDVPNLHTAVNGLADLLVADPRFNGCDLDLVRALFYLLRDDARIRQRVLKWLRCEDLAGADRAILGDLVPRPHEEAPLRMIVQLGRLMGVVHMMPLVLCVDQLEDMKEFDAPVEQFRRAINTLVAIAGEVPSSVVVISCLDDYYTAYREHLPRAKRDRLETNPPPIRLTSQRAAEEVVAIVARRLQHLYEEMDATWDAAVPTFPFTAAHLQPLAHLRTRDILDHCRWHRDRCVAAGRWSEPNFLGDKNESPPAALTSLEQIWNDFQVTCQVAVPEGEEGLAELLAWAIRQCRDEMPEDHGLDATAHGRMLEVEASGPGGAVDKLLIGVCDKAAQGGGLGRQIADVEKRADSARPVLVRSMQYPSSSTASVAKQITKLLQRGGRRVVVEDAEWRKLVAFRAFHAQHHPAAEFASWVREGRPLTQLPSLRTMLDLDHWLRSKSPAPSAVPAKSALSSSTPAPGPAVVAAGPAIAAGPLVLGKRSGVTGGVVGLEVQDLTYHAAFLGGSGSGKTTAALNLIEQLLERGIPAVLLDRKGDLCRYADPSAWDRPLTDPERLSRRQRLRERLDVAVYTPGEFAGRPLAIQLVPEGVEQLPTLEREQIAGYAAAALGGMMGLKNRGTDLSLLAILRKAIEVLVGLPGIPVTVDRLQRLVAEQDDALVAAVGGFEDRHYRRLAESLLTLWLHHQRLLAGDAEQLDIDTLLGLGSQAVPGKTRLSVISTRFLGDAATVDFWVTQLLVAVGRWIGKRPSAQLQAVLLFDEADLYLPALRQPATKAPMENLVKRARSAGVGVMLATQSPGDFDYKCRDNIRTWLVGRIKE